MDDGLSVTCLIVGLLLCLSFVLYVMILEFRVNL